MSAVWQCPRCGLWISDDWKHAEGYRVCIECSNAIYEIRNEASELAAKEDLRFWKHRVDKDKKKGGVEK